MLLLLSFALFCCQTAAGCIDLRPVSLFLNLFSLLKLKKKKKRLKLPPSTHAGVCRNLKSIVVQIGIEDYFEDPNSPEARKLFDEMVNKLQVTAHLCLRIVLAIDQVTQTQIFF